IPMFGRQAVKVGGKFTFFGNLVLEAVGGGPGLIDMHYESAKKKGIDVRFEAKAHRLLTDARGAVTGVEIRTPDGGSESLAAKALVLASGRCAANGDMRTHTYVKYGREVIKQPRRAAFQSFDQKVVDLIREEYRIREVTKAEDATLEGLARKLEIDVEGFVRTVREFNTAVQPGTFNPAIKDGKGTRGIKPPKSNWAQPLDTPPYVGYAVTTGITFTFGGLKITERGEVIDCEQRPIPGLFAAGELVGGLFYHNYPGGAGPMAGAVSGRLAGRPAARASPG